MKTYTITFLKHNGTHQTVKVQDIDSLAAQMTVIIKYDVQQIVRVQK